MCIRDRAMIVSLNHAGAPAGESVTFTISNFESELVSGGSFKAVSYTHLDVYKRQAWTYPDVG